MSASAARILIVDDESDLVTALCRILRSNGYRTAGAASASQALDVLRGAAADETAAFDLLITDLMMPGMDGLELLRAAHAIDGDLVSIVMTGHGTINTAVEAMKVGALDYLLKPFNLSAAMPVLSRALSMRKLRLENSALLRQMAVRRLELEESNRQLQSANKDLDAYNTSVSHDLRGHLNGIIGFSELLRDQKCGELNSKQQEFLGYIADGGQKMMRLTDDLLRFARIGQQQLCKERVSVITLIHQVADELGIRAGASPVKLRVGSLPDAFADPPLLKQVFVNLLSNAIKFSSRVARPIVTVEGHVTGEQCTYSVRDNGAGFDMAKSDQLFKLFHRLDAGAEFEGTGIGLSIVQRIVERHGGSISVDAGVGTGAQFTLTLPRQARQDPGVASGV